MLVFSFFLPLCTQKRITSIENLYEIGAQNRMQRRKTKKRVNICNEYTWDTELKWAVSSSTEESLLFGITATVKKTKRNEMKWLQRTKKEQKRSPQKKSQHSRMASQHSLFSVKMYKVWVRSFVWFCVYSCFNFRFVYDKFYDIYIFIASNDGNPRANIHFMPYETHHTQIVYHSVSIC